MNIFIPDQSRDWSSPIVLVDSGLNPFWAIELAADPLLFDSRTRQAQRSDPVNFFSSWEAGLLQGTSFTLPADVWNQLRQHDRLYYRLHTSSRADSWQQHQTSTPDSEAANAPFFCVFNLATLPDQSTTTDQLTAIWRAAEKTDTLRNVHSAGIYDVVLYRHQSSPKRPVSTKTLEWIVIASGQSDNANAPTTIGIVRLDYMTLTVKGETSFQGSKNTTDAADAALIMQANPPEPASANWHVSPDNLVRIGDLWLLSNLAPSPSVNSGGSSIVHAQTGQLVFSAATKWTS